MGDSIRTTRHNPVAHHRRSIHISGFDYATPGLYFIALCAYRRKLIFGRIQAGVVVLNAIGQSVLRIWEEVPSFCLGVGLDDCVVMPDHVHAALSLRGVAASGIDGLTLHEVVRRFKSTTSTRYLQALKSAGRPSPGTGLWQRGYLEHVIRDEDDRDAIRWYIAENAASWEADAFIRRVDARRRRAKQ